MESGRVNTSTPVIRKLGAAEAFYLSNQSRVDNFLDRNGYTAREVRGIAQHAITLWETQPAQ